MKLALTLALNALRSLGGRGDTTPGGTSSALLLADGVSGLLLADGSSYLILGSP